MKAPILKMLTLSSLLLMAPGCADPNEDGDSAAAKAGSDQGTSTTDPVNAADPDPNGLCSKSCEAFARCGGDAPQSNADCMAECLARAAQTLAKLPKACINKEELAIDCVLQSTRCEDWLAWLNWIEGGLTGPAPLCEAQTRDVQDNCWSHLEG